MMKRLLFAGMIFLSVPSFTQTKAGRTDTVTHAVFYACNHTAGCCSAAAGPAFSSKEQRAAENTKTKGGRICIRPRAKRRQNLSGKEIMKTAVTNNADW